MADIFNFLGSIDMSEIADFTGIKDPLPVSDVTQTKSAYNEVLTVSPTPVIQITAQYGLVYEMLPVVANGGVAGVTENMFSASSGLDPAGFAAITSINQQLGQLCPLLRHLVF